MSVNIRCATRDDIDDYMRLQGSRWDEDNQASRQQLVSRLKVFPQGMMVAEDRGEIIGMVSSMRISSYNLSRPKSWYQVTNNGYCDNHDPNGKILFGVDLSTKKGRGSEVGDLLLIGIARLAIRENIKTCMLGGRMPGYYKYSDKLTAEEYLWSKNTKGEFLDRQVEFYSSISGLRVIKTIPDYFMDAPSKNYGVLLKWENPFYGLGLYSVWGAVFPLLFRLESAYENMIRTIRSKR